ncbi:MAG: hypothetical protein AAFQ89_00570 [Cyanobacteria bacterium J06626_18]
MTSEFVNSAQVVGDDLESLARLRSPMKWIMADDKISLEEADAIGAALIENGQVALDGMNAASALMREKLAGTPLEFG